MRTFIRRGRAVLPIFAGPGDTLPPDSTGVISIFPDTLSGMLAPEGDDVTVVVSAENSVASGVYRMFFNGCSVQTLAGPDTLFLK